MKPFVRKFFEINQSAVDDHDSHLSVALSDELKEVFGQDALKLVFEAEDVNEDAELVTHGSYVLNTIYNLLQDRGVKIVSKLAEQNKPTKERIDQLLRIDNGDVISMKLKKDRAVDVVFNFKVTFLSDEKSEELFSIGIDQRNTVFDAGAYYTNDVLSNSLTSLSQKGAIEISRKDIELQFRQCLKAVSQRAQDQGKLLQNDIHKRLHHNVSRIKGFYTAQMQELHRNQPSYEEKRMVLQRELDHKLKEEINNHKLRIVIKLLSYHVIERAETDVMLKLKPNHLDMELELPVVFDHYTGEIDYGPCPGCRLEMDKIILSSNGKIGCSHCIFTCKACKKTYTDTSKALNCHICDAAICHDCAITCSQCGHASCDEHSHACDIGHEIMCDQCLTTCTECGKKLCEEHAFHCSATNHPVCFEHRVICKTCRKVYSKGYVEKLKKKDRVCPECRTEFV
ncbi:hypothetical protein HUU42_09945 [bacterium]|nr:hypothetical protein [bacterium]